MILNCITVDDEPLALELLNTFINKTSFLQLHNSYSKASEALLAIQQPNIHLVFLDIHMPGISGIEIARQLYKMEGATPRVIFTTAHNQFAVESYEVEALSYLLKPFDYEDFLRAAQKGMDYFEKLTEEQSAADRAYFFVKVGFQQVKILIADVKYVQGLRDYILIHLNSIDAPIMTLMTLKSLMEKLPSDRFMRMQRSFIVNLDSVSKVAHNSIWIETLEIKVGEQYRSGVRNFFEKKNF